MILSKNISVFVLSFAFMSCGKIHIQAGDAKLLRQSYISKWNLMW